jgi:hypothetical protein
LRSAKPMATRGSNQNMNSLLRQYLLRSKLVRALIPFLNPLSNGLNSPFQMRKER